MPRNKPRIEFVTVTPDGFRYRGRIHANTNNLLKWFKEHFRDPIPGAGESPLSETPWHCSIEAIYTTQLYSTKSGSNCIGGVLEFCNCKNL